MKNQITHQAGFKKQIQLFLSPEEQLSESVLQWEICFSQVILPPILEQNLHELQPRDSLVLFIQNKQQKRESVIVL